MHPSCRCAALLALLAVSAVAGDLQEACQADTCEVPVESPEIGEFTEDTTLMQLKDTGAVKTAAKGAEAYRVIFPLPESSSLVETGAGSFNLNSLVKTPSFNVKLDEPLASPQFTADGEEAKEHCVKGSVGTSTSMLICQVPGGVAKTLTATIQCTGRFSTPKDKQEVDFFHCAEGDSQRPKMVQAMTASGASPGELEKAAVQMAALARRLPADARLVVPEELHSKFSGLFETERVGIASALLLLYEKMFR